MSIRPKQMICKKGRPERYFDRIPPELITEVLARVASSSTADLHRAKSSCKTLNNLGGEGYVLRHANLEDLPIIPWPKEGVDQYCEKVDAFVDLCRQNENSEAIFRQGVINYFLGKNVDLAFEYLKRAAKSGHAKASYVVGLIMIFNKDKKEGIKQICEVKRNKTLKGDLKECREWLKSIIRQMWLENAQVWKKQPSCCTLKHQYIQKSGWVPIEDDDQVECDACICDNEIASICKSLPNLIA